MKKYLIYNSTPGGVKTDKPWAKRRPKTEEEKQVLRARAKERWQDPLYLAKQKAAYEAAKPGMIGKIRALASTTSATMKKMWNVPGKKKQAAETYRKSWSTDSDRKEKASQRMRRVWQDPDKKLQRSAAIKTARQPKKPLVYLLCGVSGSGKSWVANQLTGFTYIPYDQTPKKQVVDAIKKAQSPILFDPPVLISTFIRKNDKIFDFRVVVIMGDFLQVKQQIIDRGGKITPGLYRRWKRMKQISATYGTFTGDSTEALKYLRAQ